MAYSDFTLESVESTFRPTTDLGVLFPSPSPVSVPTWLAETLKRGQDAFVLDSEKLRSEILVVPILLAVAENYTPRRLAIFSGQPLDSDPSRGLTGACDFLIAKTQPVPRLKSPILSIVEAEKSDLDLGLGQCVAQMLGARFFNELAGEPERVLYGCVTSGREWQFLRLADQIATLDCEPIFLDNLEGILSRFHAVLEENPL